MARLNTVVGDVPVAADDPSLWFTDSSECDDSVCYTDDWELALRNDGGSQEGLEGWRHSGLLSGLSRVLLGNLGYNHPNVSHLEELQFQVECQRHTMTCYCQNQLLYTFHRSSLCT